MLGLKRGKRRLSAIGIALVGIGALTISFSQVAFAATVPTGPVGTAAGFEDNDGNMVADQSINFDWNNFSSSTWTVGSAPYRQTAPITVNGWTFAGVEDATALTTDTGFAGGTKQDNNCPSVIGSKAPNKDDLRGIMIAFKTIGGFSDGNHTFLMLNWTRLVQNSTSSSAHVGFEFNQGTTACPAGSDGLVSRTAGDLLLVYDFTGGSKVPPTLSLSRWVTSGSCQVGASAPPCWGTFTVLPCGTAEANVDTGLTVSTVTQGACSIPGGTLPSSVVDAVTPGTPSTTSTLGTSEFGEAGVDLTKAGVFPPGQCENFGHVEGISRSSGDSNTAAMEDLVGPGIIHLSNCGEIKIIKNTDPRNINQVFGYTDTIVTNPSTTQSFSLNDGGAPGNTNDIKNVVPGSYTVTETQVSGYTLESLSCTTSDSGSSGIQHSSGSLQVDITVDAGGLVTCTYVNQPLANLIVVKKTNPASDLTNQAFPFAASGSPSTNPNFTPTTFNLCTGPSCASGQTSTQTYSSIVPGTYSVGETVPSNWTLSGATCSYTAGPDTGNTGTLSSGTVTGIALNAGDTVTCTFTDTVVPGSIQINKVCNPNDPSASFNFTDSGFGTGTFALQCGTNTLFSPITPSVQSGTTYSVSETVPASWTLINANPTCSNGSTASNIIVTSGNTTVCTFENDQGAILITKLSDKNAAPLQGATFSITNSVNAVVATGTTDSNGNICVGQLPFDNYTVTETAAPHGFSIDTASQPANVNSPGSCPSGPSVSLAFTDTPLTDLTITVTSEAPAPGGTTSTITCTADLTSTGIGNSPQSGGTANVFANSLKPGDYTCKVHIDP